MDRKDWILLIIPVILNGGLIFIFQNIIKIRIEKLTKKNLLKDEIILEFFKELQKLNKLFIDVNIEAQKNPESIPLGLTKIENLIVYIIQIYDTNIFDLKQFENEYNSFNNAWNEFIKTYIELTGKILTNQDRKNLGEKIQTVKDMLKKLIIKVREIIKF